MNGQNKNTVLSSNGYEIKKTELSAKELNGIRSELTVKPVETSYTCAYVDYSFPVFSETTESISVPRYWGISKFGQPAINNLNVGAVKLDKKKLKLTGSPRDYQIEPLEKSLKFLKENGGCTLQVACGWGKSFSGVILAYKLGLKTIVVVPRVKIISQWVAEIKRFIPGARVGIIQGKIKEIDNVDFAVATLQTIGLKDFKASNFKSFGFTILDEIQFYGCDKMSTTLWKTYSKYNLALSATPDRADGLDKIFVWYLGTSIVKSIKPMTRTHNTAVKIIYAPEKFYDKRIESTGNINLAGMINELVVSKPRFKLILEEIDGVLLDDRRKVLVMADRREYLKNLCKETKLKHPDKECLLFLGGTSKKKLKEIDADILEEKYDIIFATYSLIGVGVSIDYLNTAIFATPKKDKMTEQASGRIMRKDHAIEPLLIDIVDNNGIYKNQARARRVLYNKKKWVQRSVNLDEKTEKYKVPLPLDEKKKEEDLSKLLDLI